MWLLSNILSSTCVLHLLFWCTRITWVGHVERMDEMAMPKRVLRGKLYAKRRIGRTRLRWTDDVTDDLRRMGIRSWTEKARKGNGGG